MKDTKHRMAEVLRNYRRGCNSGNVELLKSTMAEDVVVYFLHTAPMVGRSQVADLWHEFHIETGSRWTIDRLLTQGSDAVMEWSLLQLLGDSTEPTLSRGVDWFVFSDGRISEIRQYYDSRSLLPSGEPYEQKGFPYRERGYPQPDSFDSMVP